MDVIILKCPKCHNNLSYSKENEKWFCRVCNEWQIHSIDPIKSKWETKNSAISLGLISAFVNLAVIYFYRDLLFFWEGIGIFLIIWTVLLPIIGCIFVFFEKYKVGGVILIVGCIVFFPIGYIGVHGGVIARNLS